MKKILFVIAMMVFAAASAFAAVNDSASIMFPMLDMGVGARALGMGGAYTAVADDASAIYWNAAGLGNLNNIQLGLTYDKWFMDTYFSQILLACPLPAGTIGADIVYLNLGSLQGRDAYGAPTQQLNPYNMGGSLAYGINMGDVSAGLTLEMINQSSGTFSNTGIGCNVGLLYKTGIFSAGLDIQNIGSESAGNGYTLPMNIKAGIALKILDTTQNSLLAAIDTQYLFNDADYLSVGAEYVYDQMLAIRVGYKAGFEQTNLQGLTGISGGVGLKFANFNLDYAVVPYGELGTTQWMMLTYMFGNNTQKGNTQAGNATAVKPAATGKVSNTVKTTTTAAVHDQDFDDGLKLQAAGKVKEAIEKFTKVVTANPKNVMAWNYLGRLYYIQKNKKYSIVCYEKYLKLKPDDKTTAAWLKKYKAEKSKPAK